MSRDRNSEGDHTTPEGVFDKIGYWSEVKLDIVREYASAYSRILSAQRVPKFHHHYIDAFAGAGMHVSKRTGGFVPGSPRNALLIDPPFADYHLIDLDGKKIAELQHLKKEHSEREVFIHHGDCNRILLEEVFPGIRYEDYCRALCLLDPYGLHLDWQVIEAAGKSRTIEMFLNFPVADMNRNALWREPAKVSADQIARMTRFWGDDSWRLIAYERTPTLFGEDEIKVANAIIAEAFCERLKTQAGFRHVPKPMPMRNSKGATVYYLVFAAHKPVAAQIVTDIFDKYRNYRP